MKKIIVTSFVACSILFGAVTTPEQQKLLDNLKNSYKQIDEKDAKLLETIGAKAIWSKEKKDDFKKKNGYLIKPPTIDTELLKELQTKKEEVLGVKEDNSLTPQQRYLKKQEDIYKNIKRNMELLGAKESVWDGMIDKSFENFKINSNFEEIMNKKGYGDSFTIFYIIDSQVSDKAIIEFSHKISKLKEKYPGIVGRVVLRGWIDQDIKKTAMRFQEVIKQGAKNIKINPINWEVFDTFGIKEVPAYGLSYCNNADFWMKTCDNRYLVKGDVGLIRFFEILGDHEEKYKKYYFDLINVKGAK